MEPTWPPSLRLPICWSPSRLLVVGSSALRCVDWLIRVVVMLIGAGRVVVVLIGTSPSLSLWFAQTCLLCLPVISNQNDLLHSDTTRPGLLRTRCWVVGIVLSGRRLVIEWVVWIALSWCQLKQSCCRDAEWYITIYRVAHASLSSFAGCQIACNLERVGLSCSIAAVMPAWSPVLFFRIRPFIY